MKKKYLIVLMVSVCSFVYSQERKERYTLSGTITETSSKETLIGVNILVPEIQAGTISNEYGFYSISLPEGFYEIVFSNLGFESQTRNINLNQNIKLDISLSESVESLEEVVISSDVERLNIKKPQMSVNALTVNTIKKIPVVLGESDIIKAITLLPGVTSAGEGASGFNVRGGAADQNLILLDEATLYSDSHLFGFFSVFNPDAIKDLKLYKGGIPARFGGRISSVLDIYQKDGNKNEFKATGGIGLVSSRAMLEGPIVKEKASFLIAGRSSYAHLFLPLLDNDNIAYFYDLNTKLSYDINNKNSLYLSGYFGRDVFEISDSFSNTYGNSTFNLRWNHLFSDKLFSNLSLIYSDYYYGLTLDFVGFDFDSGIQNTNLKYDFKHYVTDKVQLNYGLQSNYYKFNPGEIKPNSETSGINPDKLTDKFALENALYLDTEWEITNNLSMQVGLRFSNFVRLGQDVLFIYENDNPLLYNSALNIYEKANPVDNISINRNKSIKTFNNIEPRLALSYQLNNVSSVKASYNRMAQYIHLVSNTTSPTPFDVYAPSGKYIEPQIADQVAVGYYRNFTNYALETEAFYKKVDNRLDYIDGADLIANDAIEQVLLNGQARAYGLEVLLRKTKGRLQGWIAYTLSKSEQQTPGRTPEETGINNGDWYNSPWDKTHDISITGSYELNKKWTFGANFIFQTGQPYTFPDGQYVYNNIVIPTFESRNSSRLAPFHHLDLSATLTPKNNEGRKWKSEWVFSIYNVYNRMNTASLSFRENTDIGRNEVVRLSIFGIIPAVTYNFKF